jgi:putative colanic acid biosynthesis acetyltransferase WcaF
MLGIYLKRKHIELRNAPTGRDKWSKPPIVVLLWILIEWCLVTNPLQLSSRVRVAALRMFGAKIGKAVIFRPRTRVKCPWNLEIGNFCWIGEGVWFHNQDRVQVGDDVCISQETFLTTGSHDWKKDMALLTKPITIGSGVWIASRCNILMGANIGNNSIVSCGVTVSGIVPTNVIVNFSGSKEIDLGEN